MTQVHIIDNAPTLIDISKMQQSTNTIVRGVVNQNGQFSVVHRPPRGWYVQHKTIGVYTIVHNLNHIDYGISVSKITDENLSIETSDLTPISFTVTVKKDGELIDKPFIFALNKVVH